jgi:hypothetical protein
MKKVYYILGAALLIITICMILLVFKGVSLRSEPIIKPSPVDAKYENITYGVIRRMFPSFQKTDYVVWGINPSTSSEEETIFELLQNEYAAQFGAKPNTVHWTDPLSSDDVRKCVKPCWITIEKEKASSLKANDSLKSIQAVLGQNYFSITFLEFERDIPVPQVCEMEQRLDFSCILPVAVREVRKYFKQVDTRYFFTRAYNEVDYFLFIEKKKN